MHRPMTRDGVTEFVPPADIAPGEVIEDSAKAPEAQASANRVAVMADVGVHPGAVR